MVIKDETLKFSPSPFKIFLQIFRISFMTLKLEEKMLFFQNLGSKLDTHMRRLVKNKSTERRIRLKMQLHVTHHIRKHEVEADFVYIFVVDLKRNDFCLEYLPLTNWLKKMSERNKKQKIYILYLLCVGFT